MLKDVLLAVYLVSQPASPALTTDQDVADHARCVRHAIETHGRISVEAVQMDRFCRLVVLLDPSISL